ncbi:putative origin recognition complex, subunit 5-like protein [Pholiota conissans]|uniref:Origin recognition complex, subunit 5-like protein n=1 Tax=Pholiota conissans TaxID=109636 RepID=A0A9P5Z2K5_9AGAR|nr:putative origin recognition complex, subunit 5-like protein [Pholiota conissans]
MEETTCNFPGYEDFHYELGTLFSTYPPPFIYVRDPETSRTTSIVIDSILRNLSGASSVPTTTKIHYARVDCVSSFTARLIYESIINTLVGWEPTWQDGCGNWSSPQDIRWNDSLDSFIHGLRAAHAHLSQQKASTSTDKTNDGKVRFVIVVERAERLSDSLPELLVPFTRLAELARLDLSVVFLSQVEWEDIKPPLGASPDPYYMDIQSLSKEDIVRNLISNFPALSKISRSNSILQNIYHPSLKSLYAHFITILCDVCYPFTHNLQELQYIAAARWPGFRKPLLDEYKEQQRQMAADVEAARMRLNRLFNSTITTALDALLPRLTNAADWARDNEPPEGVFSLPRGQWQPQQQQQGLTVQQQDENMTNLPRISKFILIASFIASTNPPKSDLRMFGRGVDERKRKRRATKAAGKSKSGGPPKVAQRLVGPTPFVLDRMIAILGALLEDNDVESRLADRQLTIPGEHTDMEIARVGIFSSVMEQTSMRLLHRTTHADRLDGPPMFKCAISYDAATVLAKELKITLNDLLWDPIA